MTARKSQCDLILERLQRGEASTWELMHVSGSLAVHSRIAELRVRGVNVEHRRAVSRTANGRQVVSFYRLAEQVAA